MTDEPLKSGIEDLDSAMDGRRKWVHGAHSLHLSLGTIHFSILQGLRVAAGPSWGGRAREARDVSAAARCATKPDAQPRSVHSTGATRSTRHGSRQSTSARQVVGASGATMRHHGCRCLARYVPHCLAAGWPERRRPRGDLRSADALLPGSFARILQVCGRARVRLYLPRCGHFWRDLLHEVHAAVGDGAHPAKGSLLTPCSGRRAGCVLVAPMVLLPKSQGVAVDFGDLEAEELQALMRRAAAEALEQPLAAHPGSKMSFVPPLFTADSGRLALSRASLSEGDPSALEREWMQTGQSGTAITTRWDVYPPVNLSRAMTGVTPLVSRTHPGPTGRTIHVLGSPRPPLFSVQ